MKHLVRASTLFFAFLIIGTVPFQHASAIQGDEIAAVVASDTQAIDAGNLLTLSVQVHGTPVIPDRPNTLQDDNYLGGDAFTWSVSYDSSDPMLQQRMASLANGVYTLQLYQGAIGNGDLRYSGTLPSDATSSGSFAISALPSGNYFLMYSVTYPEGEYPLGTCAIMPCASGPIYSLSDFERLIIAGNTTGTYLYPHPIPAMVGMFSFSVRAPGPYESNILFLPGTMESRLYKKDTSGEHLLWEPTHNSDISALAFKDGVSVNQVYTRDIVDYLYSSIPVLKQAVAAVMKDSAVMYGPFEAYLDSRVSAGKIVAWQAFPYDWRYDVDDIVANGTLVGSATGTPQRVYLQDVVQELASSSATGKVTIIAHSNGGLLAKALAVDMQSKGELNLIDQIIMVGTPQFGTPATVGNLLHGDGQTRALGLVTQGATMRSVGALLPGPYDLLPASSYFSYVETPVISFGSDSLEAPYRHAYGNPIVSYDAFSKYVTDSADVHATSSTNDLRTPIALQPALLAHAQTSHDAIDAWVPPPTLSLTSITGMGQPTISGYVYAERQSNTGCSLKSLTIDCSKKYELSHEPTITSEGDDTVVSISAAGNPGTQYYFDTQAFLKDSGTNIVHQSLLSAPPIQNQISDLLEGATSTEKYLTTTMPEYQIIPPIVVSTHSPVDIVATDAQGKQSGVVPIPGTDFPALIQDIPGSSVQILDDEKYIYLPAASSTYSFTVEGYDTGRTDIELGTVASNGIITPSAVFADLPTTAHTTASFTLSNSVPSSIALDTFGTGTSTLIAAEKPAILNTTPATEPTAPGSVTNSPISFNHSSSGSPLPHVPVATTSPSAIFIRYLQLLLTLLKLKLQLIQLLKARA